MNRSFVDILVCAFPGVRSLIDKDYFSSAMDVLLFSIVLFWAYSNNAFYSFLLPLLLLSNYYREQYRYYWRDIGVSYFSSGGEAEHMSPDQLARIAKPPRWWLPVFNWNWLLLVSIVVVVQTLAKNTGVDFSLISDGWPTVVDFTDGLLHPHWDLLDDAVFLYARQTVEVALLGTFIGFIFALPISFFAAKNIMSNTVFAKSVYYVIRTVMTIIRAVPTFLLGLFFVALVGLGTFPGVLAISMFSTGVMVKLFSEVIESTDIGLAEAVSASGGNWVNMVVFGIFSQAYPAFIAQLLYCVEINVHSATVLGLIGAEGIGLPIYEYLSALAYDRASVFIFVTILMTIVIDYSSAYIRNKLV